MFLHDSPSLPGSMAPLFISFFIFRGGRQPAEQAASWSCVVCIRVTYPQLTLKIVSLLSLSPGCSCGSFSIFLEADFPFIP